MHQKVNEVQDVVEEFETYEAGHELKGGLMVRVKRTLDQKCASMSR